MNKTLIVSLCTVLVTTLAMPKHCVALDPYSPFAVYVEGNYTKPSNNQLSVGDFLFANSPVNNFDGGHRHTFVEPKNEFDYSLGFTYHLGHTRNWLFLDYDHFDLDEEKADIDLRNICYLPPPDTFGFARLEINAYEFRTGIIHELNFNRFNIDLMAFVENVRLTQTLFGSIVQDEGDEREYSVFSNENKVHGFGPGIGIQSRVFPPWMLCDWDLFAAFRVSLLQSQYQFRTTYEADDPKGGIYNYESDDSESIVTKLDVQFGINYHHALRREMRGMKWDVSLGIRYMNMFSALRNGNTAFNPNAAANALVAQDFPANFGPAEDWGRFGPFLRFKIGGVHS